MSFFICFYLLLLYLYIIYAASRVIQTVKRWSSVITRILHAWKGSQPIRFKNQAELLYKLIYIYGFSFSFNLNIISLDTGDLNLLLLCSRRNNCDIKEISFVNLLTPIIKKYIYTPLYKTIETENDMAGCKLTLLNILFYKSLPIILTFKMT